MPRARTVSPSRTGGGFEFNHAMLYTRNLNRSLRFYRDLLGFSVIEVQRPFYARLTSPRGRSTIALHLLGPKERFQARTEGTRLYFETRKLDEECARLARAGAKFTQAPQEMPWGWRHAYLTDPDGHELSLYWAGRRRFRPSP